MVLQRPSLKPAASAEASNTPDTTINDNEQSDESSGNVPQTQQQRVSCNHHILEIPTVTVRPADYVEAVSYVQNVKDHFHDRIEVYNQFLGVLEQLREQEITIREAACCVSHLFDGHNDLIIGFYSFMPSGYKLTPAGTSKRSR